MNIYFRKRQTPKQPDLATSEHTRPLMSTELGTGTLSGTLGGGATSSDPVELRRLNFKTPGMLSHPPIPITELGNHIDRLKANDNLMFSQEYEVSIFLLVQGLTFCRKIMLNTVKLQELSKSTLIEDFSLFS